MTSLIYEKWPFSQGLSSENSDQSDDVSMWKNLFQNAYLSANVLTGILKKTGVPVGLKVKLVEESPLMAAYLWKLLQKNEDAIHSFSPRNSVSYGVNEADKIKDEELIFLAFQKLEQHSPLEKFNNLALNWFELALHAGYDELAKEMFSHPEFPEPKVWQSWVSSTTPKVGKNIKLPWLHFLASTSRVDIVKQLCLQKNIDINQLDRLGRSPIFYVNSEKMLKTLLEFNPDVTIKGKDKQGIIESWTYLGVSNEELQKMKILISKDVGIQEDVQKVELNQLSNIIIKDINGNKGYIQNTLERNIPEINWSTMHQKRIDKVIGGEVYSLSSMDWFSLNIIEMRLDNHRLSIFKKQAVKGNYYFNNATKCLRKAYQNIFSSPIPNKINALDGFFTYLVLEHFIFDLNNAPYYQDWKKQFESDLIQSYGCRWIGILSLFQEMTPVFNRTGKLTQSFFEKEMRKQWSGVGKKELRELWENNLQIMTTDEHSKFWEKILRSPLSGGFILKEMLQANVYQKLPYEHLSQEHRAAFYAMATTLLVNYANDRLYDDDEKAFNLLKVWVKDWLDNQVPWHAQGEDYKWANKPETLQKIEFGSEISARVQKGRLNKKITKKEDQKEGQEELPSLKTSIVKKRL